MQNVQKDPARARRPLQAWFDVRRKRVGTWAFALNRLTGIGLTVYLFLHLAILSTLLRGAEGWNDFVELASHPLVLTLDVVLIFGMLFHGLNGVRVALVGMGVAVRSHRTLFWVLMAIGAVLLVVSTFLVFTK